MVGHSDADGLSTSFFSRIFTEVWLPFHREDVQLHAPQEPHTRMDGWLEHARTTGVHCTRGVFPDHVESSLQCNVCFFSTCCRRLGESTVSEVCCRFTFNPGAVAEGSVGEAQEVCCLSIARQCEVHTSRVGRYGLHVCVLCHDPCSAYIWCCYL